MLQTAQYILAYIFVGAITASLLFMCVETEFKQYATKTGFCSVTAGWPIVWCALILMWLCYIIEQGYFLVRAAYESRKNG